jgi:hypothetical protein
MYIVLLDYYYALHKEELTKLLSTYINTTYEETWDPLWLKYEDLLNEEDKTKLRKEMLNRYR